MHCRRSEFASPVWSGEPCWAGELWLIFVLAKSLLASRNGGRGTTAPMCAARGQRKPQQFQAWRDLRRGRPSWGLASLMRPAEIAPGEPSVCLPLCCDPNVRRSNHRGHLTRWYHCDLRVQQGTSKVWTKESYCQGINQRRGEKNFRSLCGGNRNIFAGRDSTALRGPYALRLKNCAPRDANVSRL